MRTLFLLLLVSFLFSDCKQKKDKLADEDDTVEITDFIEFFPEVALPFTVNDSMLMKKETDSATVGLRIFNQFVPDSVLTAAFGKQQKLKIYPLGRVEMKKLETYIFLKAISSSKKIAYVLAFDKDKKFIAGKPLLVLDKDATTNQMGGMDKKYTLIETFQKKSPDGQFSEARSVYILNQEAGMFSMIMTDEGVDDQEQEIINPIDTLPGKNKFSGDYIKNKRNYISIRDGENPSELLFFIHFEKDDGECAGELKGKAVMQGAKIALYRANGNPCVLEFTFGTNNVAMKELDACGSYRDIRCFFEGTYSKRKETKPKTKKKK